jgi:hypothetical protein
MKGDAFVSASRKDSIKILSIFCRYTNHDYVNLRMVRIRLADIGRAINCAMPPVLTTKDQSYLGIVFLCEDE